MTTTTVYMSGPMFSDADKWQQAELARALEARGLATYLPQRDGFEMGSIMADADKDVLAKVGPFAQFGTLVQKMVFSLDVYQLLERCDVVLFNMDGRVPDEGSVAEAAMAWAAGRPVAVFKSTPVDLMDGLDNPMITGLSSTWSTVSTPAAAADAVLAARAANPDPPPAPAHLATWLEIGRLVWDHKDRLGEMLVWLTEEEIDLQDDIVDAVGHLLGRIGRWVEHHVLS